MNVCLLSQANVLSLRSISAFYFFCPSIGLLLQLQLHRLATASRALPARLATAAHAGCLNGGLPGASPSTAASGGGGSGVGAGGGVNSNLIGVRLGSVSDLQKHLLAWCTHLAAAQGVKVWNLNSSLQDGKALLAVLHGLDPFLWPYDPLVTAPPGKKFSELKVCVSTWVTCSRAFFAGTIFIRFVCLFTYIVSKSWHCLRMWRKFFVSYQ